LALDAVTSGRGLKWFEWKCIDIAKRLNIPSFGYNVQLHTERATVYGWAAAAALLLLLLLLCQKMQAAHDDLAQPVALWLFHCEQLFNWDAGKLWDIAISHGRPPAVHMIVLMRLDDLTNCYWGGS
jgi:hypothetical protein